MVDGLKALDPQWPIREADMACAPGITGFLQTTLDRLRQWYGVSTPVKVMPHISSSRQQAGTDRLDRART